MVCENSNKRCPHLSSLATQVYYRAVIQTNSKMSHIPNASILAALVVFLFHQTSASASAQYEELSIRTLAAGEVVDGSGARLRGHGGFHVADALLSDWEGDHWASLDADLDKVALSWTTDDKYITFQVKSRVFSHRVGCIRYIVNLGCHSCIIITFA
jgi:hypothetical protein